MSEVTETEYLYSWQEGNTICALFKDNVIIGLEAAKELADFGKTRYPGKKNSILIFNSVSCITPEARKYLSSDEACSDVVKLALVVKKPFYVFLIKATLVLYKPMIPVKAFSDKASAEKWINS